MLSHRHSNSQSSIALDVGFVCVVCMDLMHSLGLGLAARGMIGGSSGEGGGAYGAAFNKHKLNPTIWVNKKKKLRD